MKIAIVGTGAMGAVYKGVHEPSGRTVAIKVIVGDHQKPTAPGRFQREAEILEQFRHPNIVRYYGRGRYQGTMYMPDSKGNVFAFDAATGERLWYYTPKYPKGFAAGLPTSRGIAIGNGKVYMAQTDGSIVGLDQATGRLTWKTQGASQFKMAPVSRSDISAKGTLRAAVTPANTAPAASQCQRRRSTTSSRHSWAAMKKAKAKSQS